MSGDFCDGFNIGFRIFSIEDALHEFSHLFLEDVGTVAQTHGGSLIILLDPLGDDYAELF